MKLTTGLLALAAFILATIVTPVIAAEKEQKEVEQVRAKEKLKPTGQPQTDKYTTFVPTKKVDADAVIDLPADI